MNDQAQSQETINSINHTILIVNEAPHIVSETFRDILAKQLDSGKWFLCPNKAPKPTTPHGSKTVGFVDDDFIYLNPQTVTEVIKIYRDLTGKQFPVGRNTLYHEMIEGGWLIAGHQASVTIHIPTLGKSIRVLKVVKSWVFPEKRRFDKLKRAFRLAKFILHS